MRLGLIARASNTGLGVQTHEMYRHLKPSKTMVINCGMQKPVAVDLTRFPDAQVVNGFVPSEQDCRTFLQDIDIVMSCETFYRPGFADLARSMGVKTVLAPNFEFLDVNDQPDLWAAPSLWRFDETPAPRVHLPVPIATDRFKETLHVGETCKESPRNLEYASLRPKAYEPLTAHHFLHPVGRPAVNDRNGTMDLLKALQFVESPISVTIRAQDRSFVNNLEGYRVPPHVRIHLDGTDRANYWDGYDGDALLMPRRFGGLCLPALEALGAGMPVIMPDISPNNTWLPSDWLVPATHAGSFRAKQHVDFFSVDHRAYAATIDRFASDAGFYAKAKVEALELRDQLSWETLLPTYQRVLGNV